MRLRLLLCLLALMLVSASSAPAANCPRTLSRQSARAAGVVFGRFVSDNIYRRNLTRGYREVTANGRAGLSLRQWKTGNIPFPALQDLRHSRISLKPALLRPRHIELYVRVSSHGGAIYFLAVLVRRCGGPWLADYFQPLPIVPPV